MVPIHGPSDRRFGFLNSAPTLRRPTAPPLVNAPLDGDMRQSKVRHDRDFIVHGPIRTCRASGKCSVFSRPKLFQHHENSGVARQQQAGAGQNAFCFQAEWRSGCRYRDNCCSAADAGAPHASTARSRSYVSQRILGGLGGNGPSRAFAPAPTPAPNAKRLALRPPMRCLRLGSILQSSAPPTQQGVDPVEDAGGPPTTRACEPLAVAAKHRGSVGVRYDKPASLP
jgi:hypothetical protein